MSPSTPEDATRCPADLDREAKLIWKRTRQTLKDEGRWRGEYTLLLERYVRSLMVGREARGRIAARGKELDARRPTLVRRRDQLQGVKSSGGQLGTYETDELKRVLRDLSRDAYTAFGSQGQLVQHPDLKTAREAEHDANDYAKELVLTPAARAKNGDEPAQKPGGKFGGGFGA